MLPVKATEDSVSALGALYQSEKADASSIFNVAMAMMGIAATYVIGAISLIDKYGTGPFAWYLVVLLPAPLWVVAAFHSLITLNAMSHGLSVRIIEGELFSISGLPDNKRRWVGSLSGDQIMDIQRSTIPHKVATVFVYAGVALSILGYTVFVIIDSWSHLAVALRISAIALYAVAVGVVATSWLTGLRKINDACQKYDPSPSTGDHDQRPKRARKRLRRR